MNMAEVSELLECTNIADKELIIEETIHTQEGTIVESEEINKNEEIPHENDIDLNEEVSEDETNKLVINTEIESDDETEDLENSFTAKKKVKKLAIFDSDSENDDVGSEIAKSSSNVEQKRIGFIDSDSENDSNQDSNTNGISEYKSVDQINEIDQDEETSRNKKIISALCDPESSDENNEDDQEKEEEISDSELKSLGNIEISSNSKRTKNTKKIEGKEKKMTAKQALEQRKEILAESQRRVRESRVSLPYHKPKARSLKEFLQNRPKLASPLGDISRGGSPSLSIKMSMQQLEIITQKMKEREKEMKEFYKSESESENEEENSTNQEKSNENNSSISNTEENHSNKLLNDENISEEKEEITNEDNTNLMETEENSIENTKDHVVEEKSETIETDEDKNCEINSEEKTILEKDELNEDEHPETVNKENLNPELDVSMQEEPQIHENEEIKETDTKKNENLVILENILVASPKPNKSEKIYNLDAETLELASEAPKDEYESYEFNLDGIEEESENVFANGDKKKKDKTESSRRRSEILEKIGELKPRLSVGPNQMIDLENGVAMPDEISRLRERFIKHNLKLSKNSHRKDISILSVSGGELHKETLSLKVGEDEDENMKPLEKPGVRLQKLREELQHQMAQRRSNLWKEKLTNKNKTEKLEEEDDNDEKSESDAKDILDNEEEEDFTDLEEEDEELEENDCDMSENKRSKSDFIDEEAEESEIEEIDEEENLLTEKECNEENDEIEEDMEDNESIIEESVPKKKVLKRIIKAFDEDSDDEMETNDTFPTIAENKRINIGLDSDDLLEDLPRNNFVTREPVLSPRKSEDNFATPVTYMTGLKNLNTSGSRFVPLENVAMEDDEMCGQSEVKDSEKQNIEETQQSQMPEEPNSLSTQDVLDICSGQFPSSSRSVSSPEITTQQLKEVFTGSMKSSLAFDTQDVEDICSGGFTGASQPPPTQEKEVVLDHNDEHLISQLIDEDELENFKKKFESPGVNAASSKKHPLEGVEEVVGTGGVIDSDDDDGDGLKLKNRRSRRLAFSDDEESSTSEAPQEEAIDLQDDDDPASDVEYDSEENEIEEQAEITEENNKEKLKASDFFENEAELSESEWGSEDEDERNLDDLEFEKGDEEKFDEDKLRTDIEKIQMRQMLDEDNREVKMLQELLLEDGELHGTGRQRQFRWKNIDAATNDGEEKKNDDDEDVYLDEDESEEQWRKERHEREMLRLKKESQEEDSLIADSQSLTFTHRSLKIKSQTGLSSQVSLSEVDVSPKVKQPFTLLNKRGSFLSRGEKILQKIAETSKVSFAAKNTNRIVFQTIDEDTKKRKASSANLGDSTPVALKKLRLSGLSPGLNNGRSKKLFEKILQDK